MKKKVNWGNQLITYTFSGRCIFANVSKDMKVCGLHSCKDYIQDAFYYQFCGGGRGNLCTSSIQIIFGRAAQKINIEKTLNYIHQVEKALGFRKLTKIYTCNSPNRGMNLYMAVGSKRWLISTPMISLYTLLIRTSDSHVLEQSFLTTMDEIVERKLPDYLIMNMAMPAIRKIVEKGERKVFGKRNKNYPQGLSSHSAGIAGFGAYIVNKEDFIAKKVRKLCPHWFK